MKLIIEENYEQMSKRAAEMLEEEIRNNPEIVLGLATGSTPEGVYSELIKAHNERDLDFSKVTTFNLDEYVGLDENHPGSYRYYMNEKLFNHVNIDKNNIHIPNGKARDLKQYCYDYDEDIQRAGGIDVQLLGIGTNGHIGFNEPGDELFDRTCIMDLTENTIKDNSRFFESEEEVPTTAITLGMGGILRAKKIILVANGKNKHEIMQELICRETVTTSLPASLLLLHPDVTIIVDKDAHEGCDSDICSINY